MKKTKEEVDLSMLSDWKLPSAFLRISILGF